MVGYSGLRCTLSLEQAASASACKAHGWTRSSESEHFENESIHSLQVASSSCPWPSRYFECWVPVSAGGKHLHPKESAARHTPRRTSAQWNKSTNRIRANRTVFARRLREIRCCYRRGGTIHGSCTLYTLQFSSSQWSHTNHTAASLFAYLLPARHCRI